MTFAIQEGGFLGGLLLGVGGTILTWQVGPAVVASGWTPMACALGLLGAAGAVGFTSWKADRIDPVLLDMANLPERPGTHRERQAERPCDWLRDNGIADLAPEVAMEALRARLSASLSFRPPASEGIFGDGHSNEAAALATAFAAMSGSGDLRRAGQGLLRFLADAHARTEPTERATALVEAFDDARRLSYDPTVREAFRKALDRHATRETLAMGLLQEARRKGIIAPNEFAWLRDVHPGLWYALDNVGRRTFHVEGLAAMDHFHHEEAAGRRLATPHIGMAAASLLEYMVPMRKERTGDVPGTEFGDAGGARG